MIFLTLLVIPLVICLIFLFLGRTTISFKEFLIHVAAQILVAGVSVLIIYFSDTHDTEVWNGRVMKKTREEVSCSHSYQCHCYTSCSGTGSSRSCTEICQTCYEHSYDVDWFLTTTNAEIVDIDRIDRQGVDEPSRWTNAKIGDPTAQVHSYTNYIKASPDTLFRRQGLVEQFKDKLPKYPLKIYDYHYLDRLIGDAPDVKLWNMNLMELNADIGKEKQVNVVVILTKEKNSEYGLALEQHWLGGKKNDVVSVIGVDDTYKPTWVYIVAWTDQELFKIKLRDDILALTKIDREGLLNVIKTDIRQFYVRKPMKDFAYLKSSITPSTTEWVIAMLFGVIVSIGLGIFFWKEEVA